MNIAQGLWPMVGLLVVGGGALAFLLPSFRSGKGKITKALFDKEKKDREENIVENQKQQVEVIAKVKELDKASEESKKKIKAKIAETNAEIEKILEEDPEHPQSVEDVGKALLQEW